MCDRVYNYCRSWTRFVQVYSGLGRVQSCLYRIRNQIISDSIGLYRFQAGLVGVVTDLYRVISGLVGFGRVWSVSEGSSRTPRSHGGERGGGEPERTVGGFGRPLACRG